MSRNGLQGTASFAKHTQDLACSVDTLVPFHRITFPACCCLKRSLKLLPGTVAFVMTHDGVDFSSFFSLIQAVWTDEHPVIAFQVQ